MKTLSVYERLYLQGLKMLSEREKPKDNEDLKECTFKPDTKKITKSPIREVTPQKRKTKQIMKKNIGQVHITANNFKCYLEEAREAAQKRKKQFNQRFAECMKKSEERKVLTPRNKTVLQDWREVRPNGALTPRNSKNVVLDKSILEPKKNQNDLSQHENKKPHTPISKTTAPFSPRHIQTNVLYSPRMEGRTIETKKSFFNEMPIKLPSPRPLPQQSVHLIDKAIQECKKALGKSWQRPF